MPCRRMNCLAKAFRSLERRRPRDGPNSRNPRASNTSQAPRTRGSSLPATVNATRSWRAARARPSRSSSGMGSRRATSSIPSFARRHEHFRRSPAARQGPSECVFARPAAQDQDLHDTARNHQGNSSAAFITHDRRRADKGLAAQREDVRRSTRARSSTHSTRRSKSSATHTPDWTVRGRTCSFWGPCRPPSGRRCAPLRRASRRPRDGARAGPAADPAARGRGRAGADAGDVGEAFGAGRAQDVEECGEQSCGEPRVAQRAMRVRPGTPSRAATFPSPHAPPATAGPRRACRRPGTRAARGPIRRAPAAGIRDRTAHCGRRAHNRAPSPRAPAAPLRWAARSATSASRMPCTACAAGVIGRRGRTRLANFAGRFAVDDPHRPDLEMSSAPPARAPVVSRSIAQ